MWSTEYIDIRSRISNPPECGTSLSLCEMYRVNVKKNARNYFNSIIITTDSSALLMWLLPDGWWVAQLLLVRWKSDWQAYWTDGGLIGYRYYEIYIHIQRSSWSTYLVRLLAVLCDSSLLWLNYYFTIIIRVTMNEIKFTTYLWYLVII